MATDPQNMSQQVEHLIKDGIKPDLNPFHHPICLSRPLRIAPSAWTQHIPFAMFLIDLIRPQTFVELGTFTGVSYCAFCQAVKALDLDTRCYAIDNWHGDPHNGFYGDEVLKNLKEHHDPLYDGFSKLIRSDFEEALAHFEDLSIDLLHIDGYHTYEAVKADFDNWLPRMSERGVMLFHDTEVRDRDFGVWRLWQGLKSEYPHFDFTHGYGLGLLAVGKSPPRALQKLLTASESERHQIREFFYRLGSSIESIHTSQMSSAELDSRMKEKAEEIQSITLRLEAKEKELRISAASLARKQEEIESLTHRLAEKEAEEKSLLAQLADSGQQLSRITSSLGWRVLSRYGRIKYKYLLPVYRMLGLARREKANDSFLFSLDTPLPQELMVGKGNALYLSGWCFHTTKKIRRLEIMLDGAAHRVKPFRQARRDVMDAYFPGLDPKGRSYRSGFWTILAIPQIEETIDASVQLKATLSDGSAHIEHLGKVTLRAEY
ncbi:MAG: class I SAM-dependent methyltransferase [Acidobacteriota bacterium]